MGKIYEERKMNQKMIFLDLDGTLLNDQKALPKENKEAIDAALAMGHKVLICTGRPLSSAKKLLPLFGLDRPGCYAITFNGGLIYDAGKEQAIYQKTLPLEQVSYVFQKAYEYGRIHVQTYTEAGFVTEYDTKESRDYERLTKTDRKVVRDLMEELNGQEPCKILTIAYDYDRSHIEGFREAMLDYCKDKMDVCFSCYEYLEFMPAGINKGNSIKWMCEYLGIPLENTVAVGDAENDITMLKTAGVGAVMKNAKAEIKQYGDYVTEKDNNEGGVAEVIRKFLLEE